MDAGAVGFSTSRTIAHRARSGRVIPGTFAAPDELHTLVGAVRAAGHGVIEAILGGTVGNAEPASADMDEMALMADLSRACGRPVASRSSAPRPTDHVARRARLHSGRERAGRAAAPTGSTRALTFFTSLRTYHMFMMRPSYLKIADLPLAERVAQMRCPEVRDAILGEENAGVNRPRHHRSPRPRIFHVTHRVTFKFTDPVEYEPTPDQSIKAEAARLGKTSAEHMYDRLLEDDGMALYMILSSNYAAGDLKVCRDMMLDPNTVTGNADNGAHVNFISDCSVTTYHLTHWTRDRTEARSSRSSSSSRSSPQRHAPLRLRGGPRHDRGRHARRHRRHRLRQPRDRPAQDRHDLPEGNSRMLQPATGYLATLVAGVPIRVDDADTGDRPGRLVRGATT